MSYDLYCCDPSQTTFSCACEPNYYAQQLLNCYDFCYPDFDSLIEHNPCCRCQNCFPKPQPCPKHQNYLDSAATDSQTVQLNENVAFTSDVISEGNCIRRQSAPSTFSLICPGSYLILYNATVSYLPTCASLGCLQLTLNGTPIAGTMSCTGLSDPNDAGTLTASTIVRVDRYCPSAGNPIQTIALQNASSDKIFVKNANITIVRLD